MAIEISNAIHAMAIVAVDDSGHAQFVGQGNVGFAPFGTGPNSSEQLGPGRYRLHMLAPISMVTPNAVQGRGEGMVLAQPLQNANGQFPIVPPVNRVFVTPSGLFDILVETTGSPVKPFGGVSAFGEVTGDVTTTLTTFSDLITVPITLPPGGNGVLEILATVGAEATLRGAQVNFQLTLDGAALGPGPAGGASFTVDSDEVDKHSVAVLKTVKNVTPGDHVVKLQWKIVGAEASASVIVSTGFEHASLKVSEPILGETDTDENITVQVVVLRFPQQSTVGV